MIVSVKSPKPVEKNRNLFTKDFFDALGVEVKNRIVNRTQAGFDKDHEKFKPYSKNYKSIRKKFGKKSDIVNLAMTGAMLDSLYVQSNSKNVKIGFSGKKSLDKARFVSKVGKVRRKFLGLDENDRDIVKNKIEDFILKNIRKAGL